MVISRVMSLRHRYNIRMSTGKKRKLTNDMYDKIRPKSAKLAWADGLPKIHKVFENIPW